MGNRPATPRLRRASYFAPSACFKSCEARRAKQDGAVEKTRTSTGCPTATSTLRVYQFRHDRIVVGAEPCPAAQHVAKGFRAHKCGYEIILAEFCKRKALRLRRRCAAGNY